MKKLMVVDVDEGAISEISAALKEGYEVSAFTNMVQALESVRDSDLIIAGAKAPGLEAMLKAASRLKRPVPVMVLAGFGETDAGIEALEAGAGDLVRKPVGSKELRARIVKLLERKSLAEEMDALKNRLDNTFVSSSDIIGKSKKMAALSGLIKVLARADATVLITGEAGAGKSLAARGIHDLGPGREGPFMSIRCAAAQSAMLELSMFGGGAFAGAHRGTVFLDGIADMPLESQAKVLRALLENEDGRRRKRPERLRARILAATEKNLEELASAGRFLPELYYRLSAVRADIPPLREREEDPVLLAQHFLGLYGKMYDRDIKGFSPQAIEKISGYWWPGNVRELKSAVHGAVKGCSGSWIESLPLSENPFNLLSLFSSLPSMLSYADARQAIIEDLEKAYLIQYMRQEKGQINRVAELMDVSTRTVNRQLHKFCLDKTFFKDRKI